MLKVSISCFQIVHELEKKPALLCELQSLMLHYRKKSMTCMFKKGKKEKDEDNWLTVTILQSIRTK